MRTHLACLSVLLAGLTVSSSGCIVLAAGAGAAGTVAYMKGDLEAEVQHNIDQVYAATRQATDDLKLHVITSDGGKDALSATIIARDAADKRVKISLKTVMQDVTKVSIRVGTFGDQTKQRLIYDKIRDDLKAMFPQPATARVPAMIYTQPVVAASPDASAGQPSQATPSWPVVRCVPNPASAAAPPEAAQAPPNPEASQQPPQELPNPPASQ